MGARRADLYRERAALMRQVARIDEAIADDEAADVAGTPSSTAIVPTELEAARARKQVAKMRGRA